MQDVRHYELEMRSAVTAGLIYFAVVFSAGFILGAVRVVYIIPRLGAMGAVLIELPVMLVISWGVCGALIRWFCVPGRAGHRAAMGAIAFALTMAAELAVAQFVFGMSGEEFLDSFVSPNGVIGLAGQIAFALFPLLRT